MLAEPETIAPPTHARARVLPPWALWVATDDDGTDWAFENKPNWSASMQEWMPWKGRVVAMGVRLNRYALEDDVAPEREGNGHLYLLAKPLEQYEELPPLPMWPRAQRPASTLAQQRRHAYAIGLALVIAALALVALAPRVLGS